MAPAPAVPHAASVQVPDAIKCQYQNPPPTLLPAGVRQLELVCSGVPDCQASRHLTTEAEQEEVLTTGDANSRFSDTFANCSWFLVSHQWLQDVIALQCSIMRHLSVQQKASTLPEDWVSELKAAAKTCATPDDVKPQDASPEPAPKACTTPEAHRGASLSATPAACACSATACHNCRKPNGPVAEERPPLKANGPSDWTGGSDPCREAELHRRLKPEDAASELLNHVGSEDIKTEPESVVMEDCTQKNSPAVPTIWLHHVQQNHQNQEAAGEVPPTDEKDQSPNKLASKSASPGKIVNGLTATFRWFVVGHPPVVPTDVKSGPGLVDQLLPSISSLSRCLKEGRPEDAGQRCPGTYRLQPRLRLC